MRFGSILDVSRRFDRRFIGLNRRRGLCRLWRMGLLLLVSVFFSSFFFFFPFFRLFLFPGGRVSSFETVTMNKLLNIIHSNPPTFPPINQSLHLSYCLHTKLTTFNHHRRHRTLPRLQTHLRHRHGRAHLRRQRQRHRPGQHLQIRHHSRRQTLRKPSSVCV